MSLSRPSSDLLPSNVLWLLLGRLSPSNFLLLHTAVVISENANPNVMGDVSSPTILPPSEPSCVSIAAGGILNATASSNSMDSPATGEVFSKSLPSDL
ncbi:hypothetical protein V6N13_046931 [Hibiscus sabdariffa]